MRILIASILAAGACLIGASEAQAQCPPYRPCGAGETWGGNRLVHQGFFGADFRPACQAHDTCNGSDRDCDRQFLNNMYSACNNSTNPGKCRRKARTYFLASRLYHTIPRPLRNLVPAR